jgi:hypothetical protein
MPQSANSSVDNMHGTLANLQRPSLL